MKTAKMLWIAMLSALLATGSVRAQDDFPNKPIHLIVPVPAGSGGDVRMRYFVQLAKQHLGWDMVIENKPGAGQSIGYAAAAKAAPNGYTLLVVSNNLTINPYLQVNPGFDPFKSFALITQAYQAPLALLVNANSEAKSVKDLVAMANANPKGLTYAHAGVGSTPFIAGELLKQVTGMKALPVPFKGDSEWLPDLMAGRVDFGLTGISTAGPLIKAGKIRALAVTTKARAHALPDVPSIAESGFPSYDYMVLIGIVAPAGTPKPIIDKLNAGFRRIVQLPAYQEQTLATGAEPVGSLPEEFVALIRAHGKVAGDIAKSLDLKPE